MAEGIADGDIVTGSSQSPAESFGTSALDDEAPAPLARSMLKTVTQPAVEPSTGAGRRWVSMMAIFSAIHCRGSYSWSIGRRGPAGWGAVFGSPVWLLGGFLFLPGRP